MGHLNVNTAKVFFYIEVLIWLCAKNAHSNYFFLLSSFGEKQSFVNQKNTIKSMIPERLLTLVPSSVRDKWANRIVEKVKAHNPALYAAIGQWSFIPDEEKEAVVSEILVAAEQVHWEILDES